MQLTRSQPEADHEADPKTQAPAAAAEVANLDHAGGDQRRSALPGGGARPPAGDHLPEDRDQVSGEGVVTAPEGSAAELAEELAASNPDSSRSRTLVWQDPLPTAAAGATMSGLEYMTAVV